MKKKTKYKKAQYGDQIYDFTNPWASNNNQNIYRPDTQELTPLQPLGMKQLPVDFTQPVAQQVQAPNFPNASGGMGKLGTDVTNALSSFGGGSTAGTVGSIAGTALGGPVGGMIGGAIGNTLGQATKFMGKIVNAGLPIINSLVQDNHNERISQYERMAYNPNRQGTGSQAIYEDGGKIRKRGRIIVTEESADALGRQEMDIERLPLYNDNPYIPQMQPLAMPQQEQKKQVSFEKIYDKEGNYEFSPIFKNFNYNEARTALQSLPEDFGGIPVQRSQDLFRSLNTGFNPGSFSEDWMQIQDDSESDLRPFKDGGSIHIKESKKGTFTKAAKQRGKGVQEFASQVLANKDNYSPAMVKKAVFAKNAAKWNKKEHGGFIEGNEYDLSMAQIKDLISKGFEISF